LVAATYEQEPTEATERMPAVFSVFSAGTLEFGARKDLPGYTIGLFHFIKVDD
jgi:hypothetical protein